MPRISAFYGIVIWMYHDEIHHLGRPHFHARYGEDEASIDIETIAVIAGDLPPRAMRLVADGRISISQSCAQIGTARGGTSPSGRSMRCSSASIITAMRSTPMILEATPLDAYAVHVRFEDGTVAEVDLSYLLDYGGVFAPLRDPEFFRRLRADREAGTIVWPNDADIAPETLYAAAQQRAKALR
ncbi:MAG: DUF2442 domain-containing protein [Solirubrobacteraceae bacterium]